VTESRRRATPVLEFIADALFGVGCMIVGLGGLCTLGALASGGARNFTLTGSSSLASFFVVGGAGILAGRALRRFAAARGRKTDDE
jgi:hypothetical protein